MNLSNFWLGLTIKSKLHTDSHQLLIGSFSTSFYKARNLKLCPLTFRVTSCQPSFWWTHHSKGILFHPGHQPLWCPHTPSLSDSPRSTSSHGAAQSLICAHRCLYRRPWMLRPSPPPYRDYALSWPWATRTLRTQSSHSCPCLSPVSSPPTQPACSAAPATWTHLPTHPSQSSCPNSCRTTGKSARFPQRSRLGCSLPFSVVLTMLQA